MFDYIDYKNIIILLAINLCLYLAIFTISLYKIFKKEDIKAWFAFIPFLRIYHILKLARIPFWTIFVPILNIVVLILFPYKIAKEYKCSNLISILAIFVPFIIIPYIAFSKRTIKEYKPQYLKTLEDVNKLEQSLVFDTDVIMDDNILKKKKNTKENEVNTNQKTSFDFIDEIDNTIINDDFVYDEPSKLNEVSSNEIVPDIVDLDGTSQVTMGNIEYLEDEMNTSTTTEKVLQKDIKDYENVLTDEAIAFGGEEKSEEKVLHVKEDLKCTRCGASLIGSNGYCPGCGLKL